MITLNKETNTNLTVLDFMDWNNNAKHNLKYIDVDIGRKLVISIQNKNNCFIRE